MAILFPQIAYLLRYQSIYNKIHLSTFVENLAITKKFAKYNVNIILIEIGSSFQITDLENYKEADLYYIYQKLVEKLIYYGII